VHPAQRGKEPWSSLFKQLVALFAASAKLQVSCCLFGLERAFPVATQADKSRGLSEFANCEGG